MSKVRITVARGGLKAANTPTTWSVPRAEPYTVSVEPRYVWQTFYLREKGAYDRVNEAGEAF